jgi:pyruvate/2-oxoglutarate/acetoin dehydrogenase E1 component
LKQSELENIDREVAALVEDSVNKAKSAPKPLQADLLTDVYISYLTHRETASGPKGRKMDRKITFKQAINEALAQEMERDKTVILMGEDVAGGSGTDGQMDAWGGVLGVTKGLWDLYGDRVMDTPITESAFVGAAIGAATAGLRPVVELMFVDFMGVCFDQIYNQAAKFRYMFGGKAVTPLVVRTMMGAGFRAAAQHSQALYPIFTHIPGLKCVVPSTPYDAKGLLIQAIRDNDPVIFFEHKMLYALQGQVPEEPYAIPFGEANYVREGNDVTIVTLARMVHVASEAADLLAKEGIECEILDLRTVSPLDEDSILESVEKTGRLVVVDEASPRCNIATDVSALVAQKSFRSLKAPIRMVTPPHTPVPFSDVLEDEYLPNPGKVNAAVLDVMRYKA